MSSVPVRKRLFVNRSIQGRWLARTALYWMLYHAVLWMAMFFYRYAEHRGAVLAGASPRTFTDLYGEFAQTHLSLWVCGVAILPLVLWDMLSFSHRIAGPLVRFQKTLQQLSDGERIEKVTLRKGDLMLELQQSFNDYLDSLKSMQPESTRKATAPTVATNRASTTESEVEDSLAADVTALREEVASCLRSAQVATAKSSSST